MKKTLKLKKKIVNFLFDHYILKATLENLFCFFAAILSAAIFAFGFSSFVSSSAGKFEFTTGGVSGVTQVITLLYSLITGSVPESNLIPSIGYSVLNIPLVIVAFILIGKRFAIFTVVNVVASSIFISLFSAPNGISQTMWSYDFGGFTIENSIFARCVLGALCTGLGSSIAFKAEISSGGIDIVSYLISMKKSTGVGKYGVMINIVIVGLSALLKFIGDPIAWPGALYTILFSSIYLVIVGFTVDLIHLKNKKLEVQIITENPNMASILIADFPHSATISEAKGAFSGKEKFIVLMVVSSFEVKRVTTLAKRVDEHAFITVCSLVQVYGNFFIQQAS